MNFSINEVDQVIERTDCSYEEAKEALMAADGNVIDAIIILENKNKGFADKVRDFFSFERGNVERNADTVVEKIKEAIRQGNVNRIAVRDRRGNTIASVPVNVGATAGVVALAAGAAPLVIISGLVAKYGLDCQFVIVKADGSETVI
ncbi:MAG: DUF4342 domain-containing protein [Erysipelotrichaceae bacterium]|nr:DUF4342 domain-containing protein [Erysipelotrichaceae bacterium]